ncbi:snapalysin [Streptomyces sp. HNM0574]|uniref:snapalysin n=1 Tax=Streptomyces sp. HNM0574 TaxID=2714954 RepID=UPI00146F720D|nr:snapalysin [Streptomyces sp. HNM0574]NLU66395.1 snapalysin [Streptomyces sp. HNM0574]
MRYRKTALTAALGFGLAASLGLGATGASTAAPAGSSGTVTAAQGAAESDASGVQRAGYTGENQKGNEAFFRAVMKHALEKQKAEPGIQQVTVTYDASKAPTFKSQIANSTQVWNSAVKNVQLQEGSNASFEYREGDDPRGSYAQTDGHGNGFIFLDYKQNKEFDSNRVTSHETGHVLGLPDNYQGPCEELMSGGGPGPSCTNDKPNAQESAKVDQLWANGLAQFFFGQAAYGQTAYAK